MALSANRLGDAMKAAVDAVGNKSDRTAVFRALAAAVVAEVQANALVAVTVSTTGTAAAQSGAGTGTVT
jgi:hypothetical protein